MMVEKSLTVLIAGRVDDILVLRRLLRETSYRVDPATSATQALRAISQHAYTAVIADDEALVGITGPKLLASGARRSVKRPSAFSSSFVLILPRRCATPCSHTNVRGRRRDHAAPRVRTR